MAEGSGDETTQQVGVLDTQDGSLATVATMDIIIGLYQISPMDRLQWVELYNQ